MASKKYAFLCFGKEMFTVESKFPSVLSILASWGKIKCRALQKYQPIKTNAAWKLCLVADLNFSPYIARQEQFSVFW